MATTFTTPNMGLVLPVVGQELGPQWATDLFNSLGTTLDTHDHSSGKGVQVTPLGININRDLGFGSFNATALRSARFTSQGAPLGLGSDVGCVYVSNGELWYNDLASHQVKLTNNGNTNFSFLSYNERTPAISGNFTILSTDAFSLYYVDTSGGTATVNLPASSAVAVGRLYIFVDIKRNAATNNITVVPNGADKINTVAGNYVISTNGSYTTFTTDGAGNWYANTNFDPSNISANLTWISSFANPTIQQPSVAGAGQNMTLAPQASTGAASGSLIASLANPGSGSVNPVFEVTQGGNGTFAVGQDPGNNSGQAMLWFNTLLASISSTNFSLWANGSTLTVSGSFLSNGQVNITNGGQQLVAAAFNGSYILGLVNGPISSNGGGSGVIVVGNRGTAPTSNPAAGAGILYAEGGGAKWRGSGGAINTLAATGSGTQNTQAGIDDKSITYSRTTTTGGTATIDTPIPTGSTVTLRFTSEARLVSGTGTVGDSWFVTFYGIYKNISGTVTRVGGGGSVTASDVNMNCSASDAANSTNARLTLTAASSEGATPTIDWLTKIEVLVD